MSGEADERLSPERMWREHLERFCPVYFRVVSHPVTRVTIDSLWGVGSDRGGGRFLQACVRPRMLVRTELISTYEPVPSDELVARHVEETFGPHGSVRAIGLLSDQLHDVRYPAEFASYERSDWVSWKQAVDEEFRIWVNDDSRWAPGHVILDGTGIEGVKTELDAGHTIGSFQLPEGRLVIGVERQAARGVLLDLDEIHLCRSAELDEVDTAGERRGRLRQRFLGL